MKGFLDHIMVSGALSDPKCINCGLTTASMNIHEPCGKARKMEVQPSGARRNSTKGKPDYEAYLSPEVLQCYAQYMLGHTICADGSTRTGDDWQKGIPRARYMKSLWRHFMDVWAIHRSTGLVTPTGLLEEALCAVLFNTMGYLHEVLRESKNFSEK